ncbi:MAG: hypothetical protein OEW39_15175 [Deltaproteobacteria bacterium]|nr:hypothetical protein [Deltaproteobacteria bacterium]
MKEFASPFLRPAQAPRSRTRIAHRFCAPHTLGFQLATPRRALGVMHALMLGLALALPGHTAYAQTPAQQPTAGATPSAKDVRGRVTGRILNAPAGTDLTGTRVVLLRLFLDAEGRPQTQPVTMYETKADGEYTFPDIVVEAKSIYQIGVRYQERLVGSETFAFPAGEREVTMNLHIPQLTTDATGVSIEEALIAVEPARGGVWVTEVIHFQNAGRNVVDRSKNPLTLELPSGAEKLEMLRLDTLEGSHELVGLKLLIFGNLPPGRFTLAYRYNRGVSLGSFTLTKGYPFSTQMLTVLVPEKALHVSHARLNPHEQQEIQGTRFDAWVARELVTGDRLDISISGIPVVQALYLFPAGGFLLLMSGVVLWFLRGRLKSAA